MPSAWVSLPGPEQSSSRALEAAPLAHQVEALERLERPDQHRGAHALRLGRPRSAGVDAVGAVDVGAARRPEQRRGARGEARRRRGRPARTRGSSRSRRSARPSPPCRDDAADQVARHLVDRALVEVGPSGRASARGLVAARPGAARAARARAASAVPPSETFDSSQRALGAAPRRLAVELRRELGAAPRRLELGQRLPALDARARTSAADDPVRLAERHAAAHQQVGDVGGREELVGRRRGHALAVERDAARASRAATLRGRARACRPRRTAAPCPPGGPCCR